MRRIAPSLLSVMLAGFTLAGDYCFETVTAIPTHLPSGITTSIEIPCTDDRLIADLDLQVEIVHTWVGDLSVTLSKQGGPSEPLIDRVGLPAIGPFGCSGDDIDATLNDEAASPIEDECAAGFPSIQGDFIPGDPAGPLMSSFDGLELCGVWELNVADHAGSDTGSLIRWCLLPNATPDDVPATTTTGLALALLALIALSSYFTAAGYRDRRRAVDGDSG